MPIPERDTCEQGATPDELVQALQNLGDAFVIYDASWQVRFLNRRAEALFGGPGLQLVGRPLWEIFPDMVGTALEASYRQAAAGEPQQFEYFYPPWKRWLLHRCFPNDTGGISTYLFDITESRTQNERLQNALSLLSLAQQAAHAGAWDWNIATGQLKWSAELFQLFGLDPNEAQASFETWRSVVHPADVHTAEQRIYEFMDTGRPLFNQYRVILPNGQVRWIDAFGETQFDVLGQPIRLSGFCIDATAQKTTEAELAASRQAEKEQQEQLELALNASGMGLWRHDYETAKMRVDQRVCQMIGLDTPQGTDIALSEWTRRIHPEDVPKSTVALQAHERGDTREIDCEYRFRHREGHWVWLHSRGKVTSRKRSGEPLVAAGTLSDVTARKRMVSESSALLQQIQTLFREATGLPEKSQQPVEQAQSLADQLLTRRQLEVLQHLANGLTSAEIARRLNIATSTVVAHRRDLMRILGLHNVAELTRYAIHKKLV